MRSSSIRRALLALSLLACGVAHGQPAAGSQPTTAPQSLEAGFGKGAEEVAARLRELTRSLSDGAVLDALQAEVAADTQRAAETWDATGRLLSRNLRTTALDSLTTSWEALRNDLEDVNGRIDVRVRRREADLATLLRLRDSWTRALDLARNAEAPVEVLERIQNTIATIDTTRPAIEQRRARVLVLEDQVTRALQTCDDAFVRIGDARREAVRRAFTPQEPPLWRRGAEMRSATAAAPVFAADVATKAENLRIYVTAYAGRLVLSGAIILALMVLLRRTLSRLEREAKDGSGTEHAMAVVHAPYSAAFLIGILMTRPLRPFPPFEFMQLTLIITTTAAVLVFRPVLEARLAAAVYAAYVLLVVSVASQLLEPTSWLEQALLTGEMIVAAGLLLWGTAQLTGSSHGQPSRRVVAGFGRLLAIVCAASAVAAAYGYLDLADFVGVGFFLAALLGLSLLAVRVALYDLIAIGLSRGPLAHLRTIVHHRARIGRGIRSLADGVLMLVWIWMVLQRFQLLDPVREFGQGVLGARLRGGALDVPVGHMLAFVVVVVGAFFATRLVGTLLEEDVYSRMTLPRGVPYALSTLTRYALLLVGFLLALATLGLDLTRITVLVSALGLGLGFGLQQIMNNFVSGLILLFERPVNVGDSIQMGDLTGEVTRIGIRSSTVATSQGAEVIVPNAKMIEEHVTNWTLSDRRRRIDLDIGVNGDVDAERILAILHDVAGGDPRVNRTPPPEALLVRLGGDATDFQLRVWTDDPQWMKLRSDLSVVLQRTLRSQRIGDAGDAAIDEAPVPPRRDG